MLRIEHLSHHFGDLHVLRDVSITLGAGELVCLLGPSGCGKTTLLRVAAGIEPCQAGEIQLDGTVVASASANIQLPPEARQVGMMFQDFALFPHLTTRQNMMFGARSEAAARGRWVEATANKMGIGELLDQYPGTLSGGQQQRVALIRALAPNPNALLLDEPFSGLDTVRRADVREQTRALIRETGIAALMVTHDPEEAMFMADRIAVMHEGRIVQIGTPDEVYFQPCNAFVASLFGPLNRLPAHHRLVSQGGSGHEQDSFTRPDNLMPVSAEHDSSCTATILQARRLGSEVLLRLSLADPATDAGNRQPGAPADPLELQARWATPRLPIEGQTVQVAIRYPDQVFRFN